LLIHIDPPVCREACYGIVKIRPLAAAGGKVRVVRRILTPLVATVLGLAAFGLAVRIYMGREAENRIAPSEAISIAELHSPLGRRLFGLLAARILPGGRSCRQPGLSSAMGAIARILDRSGIGREAGRDDRGRSRRPPVRLHPTFADISLSRHHHGRVRSTRTASFEHRDLQPVSVWPL